ncbi:MAG: hypothetical protein ACXWZE_22680 [Candidatus Binatia bacterium]
MSRHVISLLLISLLDAFSPFAPGAQQGPFPVPAGLQGAVDFWKQVFTRHGFGEVLPFDPIDPATICRFRQDRWRRGYVSSQGPGKRTNEGSSR